MDFQTVDQPGIERTKRTWKKVLRLGLSDRFEISYILNYNQDTVETSTIKQDFDGISSFQLGFRYNLIEPGDKFWPTLAIQTRFRSKAVSSDYRRNEIAPVFLLSAVKSIEDWGVALNWGPSYNGFNAVPTYNWVLSISKSLNEKWGTVGEIYGSESNGQGSTYYGAGLSYLVNSDFQLDAYVSTSNNRGIEEFYGTVGVSWRLLTFVKESSSSLY